MDEVLFIPSDYVLGFGTDSLYFFFRIIGFEGLTGGDNFKTADLERRLDKHSE